MAAASPVRARLFLDGIEVPIASHLAVGWSPDAGVELGEEHDLIEARRGWNLVELGAANGRLSMAPAAVPGAGTREEAAGGATGLVLAERPGSGSSDDGQDQGGDLGSTDPLATWARHLARRCATATRSPAPVTVDGSGALMMVACAHGRPALALAVTRSGAGRLWLVPLRASGRDFARHQIAIGKGALLQIGSPAEAAPGIEVWPVPAPAGGTRLLLPPSDPLASCRGWSRALAGAPGQADDPAGAGARSGHVAGAGADDDDRIVCVLPFTAPFALEVRRLVPDLAGLTGRALWAGCLLILPALLWLAWLAARRRTHLTRSALASALGFTFVSLVLCGLAAWRLLWAHRIDMLREVEPLGWRTLENQALVALIAATLAATAVDRARPDLPPSRRAALGLAAWLAVRLLGLLVTAGAAPPPPWRPTAAALVSLALGLGPALVALVRDATGPARLRARAHRAAHPGSGTARGVVGPLTALVIAGGAAALTAAAAPRQPGLKLACAWLVVVSFYSALRAAMLGGRAVAAPPRSTDRPASGRLLVTVAAGAGAALACLALDPGITAALVAPGLVLALILAAHDASFDDAALTEVGTFRLRHAPLVACHAALVLVVAAGVLGWAAAGLWGPTDPDLGRTLTGLVGDLPLLVAGFLAPAALLLARQRPLRGHPLSLRNPTAGRGRLPPEQSKGGKPPAAWPWALAAALALSLWLFRAPLTELVLSSHSQAAYRIAQVTSPGYALLRSPDHFLAGLTAWRETALPAAAHPFTGQGLFGARLFDPGVLLSVDNDYLAILILRETGLAGILAGGLLLTTTAAGLWLLAGERFRRGSAAQRRRTLAALMLGALALYQPLGALGTLPLTGLPWPGLGIDSPSDSMDPGHCAAGGGGLGPGRLRPARAVGRRAPAPAPLHPPAAHRARPGRPGLRRVAGAPGPRRAVCRRAPAGWRPGRERPPLRARPELPRARRRSGRPPHRRRDPPRRPRARGSLAPRACQDRSASRALGRRRARRLRRPRPAGALACRRRRRARPVRAASRPGPARGRAHHRRRTGRRLGQLDAGVRTQLQGRGARDHPAPAAPAQLAASRRPARAPGRARDGRGIPRCRRAGLGRAHHPAPARRATARAGQRRREPSRSARGRPRDHRRGRDPGGGPRRPQPRARCRRRPGAAAVPGTACARGLRRRRRRPGRTGGGRQLVAPHRRPRLHHPARPPGPARDRRRRPARPRRVAVPSHRPLARHHRPGGGGRAPGRRRAHRRRRPPPRLPLRRPGAGGRLGQPLPAPPLAGARWLGPRRPRPAGRQPGGRRRARHERPARRPAAPSILPPPVPARSAPAPPMAPSNAGSLSSPSSTCAWPRSPSSSPSIPSATPAPATACAARSAPPTRSCAATPARSWPRASSSPAARPRSTPPPPPRSSASSSAPATAATSRPGGRCRRPAAGPAARRSDGTPPSRSARP